MKAHLFFDVYIEDPPLGVYLRGDPKRFQVDNKIRTSAAAYKYQTKFNITRYSLISYSSIPWASSTIRIICENNEHESIYEEMRKIFPNAVIQNDRSASAREYLDAISALKLEDHEWIFFCPNNDHPFIGNHKYLSYVLDDANEAIEKLRPQIISIPYSHYTEHVNFLKPTQHEQGVYGDIYPKLLYETRNSYVIRTNKLLLDSIQLCRVGDLKWIFGTTKREGRVIRQEDTEYYLSEVKRQIMVIPKYEFCRHYDGYLHIADKVPPLFIPEGFFNSEIRIRYGFDDLKKGFVNINPLARTFSYQSKNGADLKILLSDIPGFWRDRISNIDINKNFPINLKKDEIDYYKDVENPWRHKSYHINFLRTCFRYARYRLKYYINKIFNILINKLKL